ncbi:hypothetical protein PV325_009778 [Microctonus aethiopoides]|nr:hypothetical protein PV325_009778 [Microctonus aethiopoides]
MLTRIICLFIIVTKTGIVLSKLPPGVSACPRNLPLDDYNKCVREQLKAITPQLIKGIPELKLPALDPLSLPSLVVDRNLEALKVKANLTKVRVYGATNYQIDEFKARPDDLSLFMKVRLPHMHVHGNYDVKGNLLLLPLTGRGAFWGNFTNTQVRVTAEGREITDNKGIEKIELNRLITKIRVGNGNVKLKAPPAQELTETAASIGKALAARALGALTKSEILP